MTTRRTRDVATNTEPCAGVGESITEYMTDDRWRVPPVVTVITLLSPAFLPQEGIIHLCLYANFVIVTFIAYLYHHLSQWFV